MKPAICSLLALSVLLSAVPVAAGCFEKDVWAAFPTTDELIGLGAPVNEQLRTDSGPVVNKDSTQTYSRRWQGASSSRGASVTLTIHPDAKLAAEMAAKMLDEGIYLAPSQFEAAFVSHAHTDADIDQTVEAARKAFAAAR